MRIYRTDNIETIDKINTSISIKNDGSGIFSLINEKFNINLDINNNDINIYSNLSDVDILEKEIYSILLKNIVFTKNLFTKKTGLIFYSNYIKPIDNTLINTLNLFKDTNIPIISIFKLDDNASFTYKSILIENYTKYLVNAGVIPSVMFSLNYENLNIDEAKYRIQKIKEFYSLVKVIFFDDVSTEPDVDYINTLTEFAKNIGYLYIGLKTNEPFSDIEYYNLINNVDNYIVKYDTSYDLDSRYVNYYNNINNNIETSISKYSFSAIIHNQTTLPQDENIIKQILKHFNFIYITNKIDTIPPYIGELIRILENYNIRLKLNIDKYEPDFISIGLTLDKRLFVMDNYINNIILNTITNITNNVLNNVNNPQYPLQSMTNYHNSLSNFRSNLISLIDLRVNNIYQTILNEINNVRNQIPRPDNITIESNNNTWRIKEKSITKNHLANNINASDIGFNADKVDGYDVDNYSNSNTLWTSDKIIQHSIITAIIFG